jgi:hypothetical protein
VVAVGLCAIAVAFAVMLLGSSPRRSGSDLTPNGAFVAVLGAGQQTCQGGEPLPADTSALQMTIGTYGAPGPPLRVVVTGADGRVLTSGGLPAGWRQGVVRIPVAHVATATQGTRVCLQDAEALGGTRTIALAGDLPDPGYSMTVAGRTVAGGRLRYDYMRPGSESWLALAPTLVHRFTLAKAGFLRSWSWVLALALVLATAALAVRTILKATADGGPEAPVAEGPEAPA